MMTGVSPAQVAADYATDATYGSGWSAGQNAGTGFGAWSFNGTDPTPAGVYQGMSSSSSIGTAWTLLNHSSSSGLANAGRAISEAGGLQPNQRFETVIQNPSTTAGDYTYRGLDMLFTGGPDNNVGGNNAAAIRVSIFDYFNGSHLYWGINDTSSHNTTLSGYTTADKGMTLDLLLTSATTYQLTLTPLNGATAYYQSGTFAGPIDYVNFRLYNTASSGLTDTANNYGISYMTIVPEPSSLALIGLGLSGLLFLRRRK